MKFTVNIPIKNEQDYIGRAISSIIIQDVDFEIIINLSPENNDGTMEILNAYKKILGDKLIIRRRPESENLHSSAQSCLEMATGDVWYAMSCHTQLPELTFKYVEKHLKTAIFGSVLHEDGTIQVPNNYKDTSSYAMFYSISFMKENSICYEPQFPNLADYVMKRRVWMMGKAQRTNKILALCSPRPYTRKYATYTYSNSDERSAEGRIIDSIDFIKGEDQYPNLIDELYYTERYPTSQ